MAVPEFAAIRLTLFNYYGKPFRGEIIRNRVSMNSRLPILEKGRPVSSSVRSPASQHRTSHMMIGSTTWVSRPVIISRNFFWVSLCE